MIPLKAIIFDMDGTLADTEEIHRLAFNDTFYEFELPLDWSVDEYRRLLMISGGKERIHHCLKSLPDFKLEHCDLYDYTEVVHKRKSEIYREKLVAGEIQLRPGIMRLITEARESNIVLAIATASSAKNVQTLLSTSMHKGAEELFTAIVTCDVIEDKKPSPAVYQFALAELGLEAEECMVIEDSRNGILAALAAGMKTIVTTHALTIDNDFSGASLVVNHMGEPDLPFTVLEGDAGVASYVDLELVQMLLQPDSASDWPVAAGSAAE